MSAGLDDFSVNPDAGGCSLSGWRGMPSVDRAREHGPGTAAERSRLIGGMFGRISGRYDLVNRLLSAGQDLRWRRQAVDALGRGSSRSILDLCTGTADLAIGAGRRNAGQVVGLDLSRPMLRLGRRKIVAAGLEHVVSLAGGDAQALPFPDEAFDGVMIAFGIRNVVNLGLGLREIARVMKPGGKVSILEFSRPGAAVVRVLHSVYLRHIVPFLGGLISGDRQAYGYLHRTIMAFPEGEAFLGILKSAGFVDLKEHRLSCGIATVYVGSKPQGSKT